LKSPFEGNNIIKYYIWDIFLDGLKRGGLTFFDYFTMCEDILKTINFEKDIKNESYK
jgi:hypothetical protein